MGGSTVKIREPLTEVREKCFDCTVSIPLVHSHIIHVLVVRCCSLVPVCDQWLFVVVVYEFSKDITIRVISREIQIQSHRGQRGGGRHFADSPININACQPSTPRHLRPCQSASTAAFLLRQGGADDRADDQTFGTRTAVATEDADADADEEGTRTADAHFARVGILFSRPVLVLLKRAFWQGGDVEKNIYKI